MRGILTKAGIGILAAAAPSNTGSRRPTHAPLRACWCRSTAATIPGWNRGPKLTLLIAVDDATGTVAQAEFRTSEDTRGYLVPWRA